MDAVTGFERQGPAYFFVIIEALADAGYRWACRGNCPLQLLHKTMLGSAILCLQGDKHRTQLKDMVTSPAGTTAPAFRRWKRKNTATADIRVEAATKRSKELAGGK